LVKAWLQAYGYLTKLVDALLGSPITGSRKVLKITFANEVPLNIGVGLNVSNKLLPELFTFTSFGWCSVIGGKSHLPRYFIS
jgi:hypothetical protein